MHKPNDSNAASKTICHKQTPPSLSNTTHHAESLVLISTDLLHTPRN